LNARSTDRTDTADLTAAPDACYLLRAGDIPQQLVQRGPGFERRLELRRADRRIVLVDVESIRTDRRDEP